MANTITTKNGGFNIEGFNKTIEAITKLVPIVTESIKKLEANAQEAYSKPLEVLNVKFQLAKEKISSEKTTKEEKETLGSELNEIYSQMLDISEKIAAHIDKNKDRHTSIIKTVMITTGATIGTIGITKIICDTIKK